MPAHPEGKHRENERTRNDNDENYHDKGIRVKALAKKLIQITGRKHLEVVDQTLQRQGGWCHRLLHPPPPEYLLWDCSFLQSSSEHSGCNQVSEDTCCPRA